MTRWSAWITAGGLYGLVALAAGGCGRERGPTFPGRQWERMAPETAGFSREKLAAFARDHGGTGCVVQGGRMVFEWGDTTFRQDVASSSKAIYAFLVFKAIETGRLSSLDEPVVKRVPELAALNPDLGHKDRNITYRHLLGQTSGYGLREAPGEAFAYNDYATGLLGWIVFQRLFDLPPDQQDDLLNGEWLGQVIGFEDAPTARHPNSRPNRIRISARDMARFALLYLRGGEWRGRDVLRRDLVAQHLALSLPMGLPRTSGVEADILKDVGTYGGGKDEKDHLDCLGGYWWFNRTTPDGTRLLPDAPPGTFMGAGYGGRFALVMMPELDLVVVWLDVHRGQNWTPLTDRGRQDVNRLLRELLAARTAAER